MDDTRIVKTFARLFKSLASGRRANTSLGVDLSSVPPRCQPDCLIVNRCDSDDLSLTSIIRSTWVVDDNGIRTSTTSPFPQGVFTDDFHLTSPKVKFSTDGDLIHYGITLGDNWYRCFQAPLVSFGENEDTIVIVFDSTQQRGVEK